MGVNFCICPSKDSVRLFCQDRTSCEFRLVVWILLRLEYVYILCQRLLQEIISPHSNENSNVNVFSVSCSVSVQIV